MRKTVAPVQNFGSFILQGRHRLGLTQTEVAQRSGLEQGYISRVERGEYEPSVTAALKLCDVLGLDINDFARNYI